MMYKLRFYAYPRYQQVRKESDQNNREKGKDNKHKNMMIRITIIISLF